MKKNIKKGDIIKVVILALIIIWIIIFFIDYFRARQSKTPIFCISEQTKEYMMMVLFILVQVLVIRCINMIEVVLTLVWNLDHSLFKKELSSSFFSFLCYNSYCGDDNA